MIYYTTDNLAASVELKDVPDVGYAALYEDLSERLKQRRYHVVHYFAVPDGEALRFYLLLADDEEHRVMISSFRMEYYDDVALPSLTALHPALHPFEREIAELYNVEFDSMPWCKPLRFSFDRRNRNSTIDNYPFYSIEGDSLHEVNVGPIHAGIIELEHSDLSATARMCCIWRLRWATSTEAWSTSSPRHRTVCDRLCSRSRLRAIVP